jgi:hypothetical protein
MFNSAILDVAIGIAFVYLFLSLVCSVVNEGIAALFALRSKNLVRGINSLFSESNLTEPSADNKGEEWAEKKIYKVNDGVKSGGQTYVCIVEHESDPSTEPGEGMEWRNQWRLGEPKSFVQAIYEHGLIRGLFPDPPQWKKEKKYEDNDGVRSGGQTYVCLKKHTSDSSTEPGKGAGWTDKWQLGVPNIATAAKKKGHVNLPSYIPSRAFSSALVGVLLPSANGEPQGLAELRTKIAALPQSPAKDALLNLVASTGKDIEEFQQKAEKWFDDSMDRAAGWYKQRAQKFLIAIGFAVAIILNVDTIKLAQQLWNNPVQRQAAVDLAQKYVDQNKDGLKTKDSLDAKAKDLESLGKQMPFPFGWRFDWKQPAAASNTATNNAPPQNNQPVPLPDKVLSGSITLIGWCITALALSLGAPFWFDTLNKFMVVRSTVKPQEKSPPEGSKD